MLHVSWQVTQKRRIQIERGMCNHQSSTRTDGSSSLLIRDSCLVPKLDASKRDRESCEHSDCVNVDFRQCRKRLRRVSFKDEADISFTGDNSKASAGWYSRPEIRQMKHKAKATALYFRGRFEPSSEDELSTIYLADNEEEVLVSKLRGNKFLHYFRGLEVYGSDQHCFSRSVTRHWAISEVLVEQSRQTLCGQKDNGKIAAMCSKASARAVRFARVLGSLDESMRDHP